LVLLIICWIFPRLGDEPGGAAEFDDGITAVIESPFYFHGAVRKREASIALHSHK